MEKSDDKLTELQFAILDGMADDYEDVEQLYLFVNRRLSEEREKDIQFPRMLLEIRFPLREIWDEIAEMLAEGYIEAKYSNDEKIASLPSVDFTLLHHYWFGPTAKGIRTWSAHRELAKD